MTNPAYQGLAPSNALQARCTRCRRIVGVSRERSDLLVAVLEHYERHHGRPVDNVAVVVEGEGGQFVIEQVPPWRCDLCAVSAEPPFWTWVTPRVPDYAPEDEEWLVCDLCHPLVEARKTISLIRRVWEVSSQEFVVDDPAQRKNDIAHVVVEFLSHVDPSRTTRGMK